nr:unnamed protein product [Leishmania braziliensis]
MPVKKVFNTAPPTVEKLGSGPKNANYLFSEEELSSPRERAKSQDLKINIKTQTGATTHARLSHPAGKRIAEPWLPQFDELQGAFELAKTLDTAIVEHTDLAGKLFARHTAMLKRHFEWANPIHSSFYYCTAVDVNGAGCTYANDSEKAVQDHIRERHPGSGATPRRFGMSPFHGGMATIGPSCSITAAVAAVCTMPGIPDIDATLLRAFRGSTADTAREVIGALGLQLPTSPGWALEKLTAQDDAIRRAFAATARQDIYCSWCGETEEGQPEPQIATVTYEAPAGGLPGTTATAISEAFGHVSANLPHHCPACRTEGATLSALSVFLFGEAVAITVIPPAGNQKAVGLPELPLEVMLPTALFSQNPYKLHAAICATTSKHVVAYVLCREDGKEQWHRYDGTVHDTDVPPPDPATIDTLIFTRAPYKPAGEGDNEEDTGTHPVRPTRPTAPPPPPSRDPWGRTTYGMHPDIAEQEEEDTGIAPRPAEPRTETHTPPSQPPDTEREGEESDTTESVHTEPDQAAEDVSQTSDEARHRFRHGENTAAQQTGTIHCPVCPRTWTSRARRQQQTSHLNTTHAREVVRVDALKATGVDRCLSCGEFVIASGNARRAHGRKCGEFVTRAVRNQKRARTEQSTPRQDAGMEPTPETPPPPTRHRTRPTEADAEWVQEFPATIRTLRKQEWGHWAEAVGHTLLGYTAAAAAGRYQRQLALTELVRTRLAKPRAPAREEDESHQEEPSETPREGERDEPYTGHAGATRRANTEEHLPTRDAHTAEERRARRILHQLSLGAVGKAARTLFQAQLPRARASEALDQLRALHPQEDPAGYPCPPQTPFPHGLKPEKVRNVVLKRLGRAAAPGLDGWTRELLVPVVENAALLAETTALMQDILAGNVSASFAFRLRACVVHPFLKEPGSPKVRPITPESVWLKIASHLALDAVEKPFRDIFQGWQFGVWGDAAEAVAQIRETYASESADTLVALDATNAYNRVSRAWVLRAAFRHHALRHTFGVVDLSLGEPGALGVYEGGRRVEQLWSTRGVRQGMVLSPLLFATAVAETLRPIMAAHPLAKVTAYLDDLTVVGPRAAVQAFLDEAGPALAATGFDINPAKSHHLSKSAAPEPVSVAGVAVPLASGVVRILGAGFRGSGAPVDEWVWEKTRPYEAYFTALGGDELPRHARMNLLRASALPRLTFLLRTHSADELRDSAAWFDDRVLHTLSVLAGGAPIEGAAALLARLPLAMGGCGLRSQLAISRFAAHSVGRKGAQKTHTHQLDQHNLEALKTLLPEPALEIVKANAAPGATRALADPALHLGDFPFEVLVRQRLLLRVLRPEVRCACGADADNAHANVCPLVPGGPRIQRHNHVLSAIEAWAKRLGFAVVAEPRVSSTSGERLDLSIAAAGGTFATDVVITFPGRARSAQQNPLQQAHAAKKRKWGDWAAATGTTFAPVSLESTGGLHKESFHWLLAVAGAANFPFSTRTAFEELLSCISRALHEGNAYVFEAVRANWARRLLTH